MPSAQPLLDRRGQPGRDDVDGERTAAEPPPQSPGGNGGQARHHSGADRKPAHARPAGGGPAGVLARLAFSAPPARRLGAPSPPTPMHAPPHPAPRPQPPAALPL